MASFDVARETLDNHRAGMSDMVDWDRLIMTQHVVIRVPEYVAGSSNKPEVMVFTQTHASRPPVPWGRLKVGETVWMKWSGGPIVARGIVEGFRQIEECTPEVLHHTVAGTNLFDLTVYWKSLPPVFFGDCDLCWK